MEFYFLFIPPTYTPRIIQFCRPKKFPREHFCVNISFILPSIYSCAADFTHPSSSALEVVSPVVWMMRKCQSFLQYFLCRSTVFIIFIWGGGWPVFSMRWMISQMVCKIRKINKLLLAAFVCFFLLFPSSPFAPFQKVWTGRKWLFIFFAIF